MRRIGDACRHDDNGRAERPLSRMRAPLRPVAPDRRNRRVENRPDIKARGVAFEIFHDLQARRIGRIGRRHRHAGQTGMLAIGVKVKAIIMTPPHRTDVIRLFE
jgi:hypothetical protein